MQCNGSWITNRIVIAIVGALLIGGISAAVGWHSVAISTATQNGGNASTGAPSTPSGQGISASGTIQRVDPLNNSFSLLESNNTLQLVEVTNNTQYTGDAASFNDLQSGAQATITGTLQADGSLSATTVNVSNG